MTGGPLEIGLIVFAILVLFGYQKLPDASRSLGRSLRIFQGEMRGMKDDDRPDGSVRAPVADGPTTLCGGLVPPSGAAHPTEERQAASRTAEAHAVRSGPGADQVGCADRAR